MKVTQKTHLVYIITGMNRGGAERVMVDLAKSLTLHKITVISLTGYGSYVDELQRNNIKVYLFNFKLLNFFTQFLSLVKCIMELKPDIVQTWLYHADLIGGLAAKFVGVKKIYWSIRTTEINFDSYSTRVVRKICSFLSKIIPNKIIYVAFRSMEKHISIGYDNTNAIVIQNGFDVKKYDSITVLEIIEFRDFLKVNEDDILIGCIGRYDKIKGQDYLLAAALNLIKSYTNVKFIFVGKDFNYSNEKLPLLKEINLNSERIILLEEVNDPSVIFKAIDIFCLPSLSEGFPNVLGEAMLAGKYCISTDVGDARLMTQNIIPIVVPGDVKSLEIKLNSAINLDEKSREHVGLELKSIITKRYSLKAMVEKYKELYSNN